MKIVLFPLLLICCCLFSTSNANIDCNYCGERKLCPLPYNEKETERVSCEKSCMKFDGHSVVDNKRVLVRSCGEQDINLCSKNTTWFGAKGVLCLCNGENCNSATNLGQHKNYILFLIIAITTIKLII